MQILTAACARFASKRLTDKRDKLLLVIVIKLVWPIFAVQTVVAQTIRAILYCLHFQSVL